MSEVIDSRLDDNCYHAPVRESEDQYRCRKCGLAVAPAPAQIAASAPSRTAEDLWELIEPKHAAPLQTTWNELAAVCEAADGAKYQRKAEALKDKGLLPKPRMVSETRWFDKRWPAEVKLESQTTVVRDDSKGSYKLAPLTADDNPRGVIGGFGRRDKELEQAIKEASAETVQLFYEKAGLTRMERKIFGLWSRNYSQTVIGKQLRVSQQAVGKAIKRIQDKLREFVAEMGGEDFLDDVFERHSEPDYGELVDIIREEIE